MSHISSLFLKFISSLCKAYLLIGFIIVILFLLLMIIACIVLREEFVDAIHEAMTEFNLDDSIVSFIVFFLMTALILLFLYPFALSELFSSDDWIKEFRLLKEIEW